MILDIENMGLIDRLLDGPTNSETVFGRALSMRGPSLLRDDTLTLDDFDAADDDGEISPGAAIRSLLKELQTQRHFGITTPSHLFSLLHRHFLVRKGVLFVPQRRGGMVPMAAAGMDRTSTYRLQILDEEMAWLDDGKHAVILNDAQRAAITQRLSRRDAEQSPRIALLPFIHRHKVVGILLILDSPLLTMDSRVLDVIVGALSESAGRRLFEGRERPFHLKGTNTVFQRTYLSTLLPRLEEKSRTEHREVQVIEVDLTVFISTILNIHPHLDRTHLLDDVLDIAVLLTQPSHTVVYLGDSRVAFISMRRTDSSPRLVVHLLTTTLTTLFGSGHMETLTYRLWSAEEINSAVRDTSHS